jgi:hypothetical protein
MADNNWGHCKGCRYFDSHQATDTEVAKCMQSTLREFDLSVSGASGCNAFEARAGLPGGISPREPAPSSIH